MEITEIQDVLILHEKKINECTSLDHLYILLSSVQSIMLRIGFLENNPLYQYSKSLISLLNPDQTLPIGIEAAKKNTKLLLQYLIIELPVWCCEQTKATQNS